MNYKYKIDEELKRHLRKKFGIIKWKFDSNKTEKQVNKIQEKTARKRLF